MMKDDRPEESADHVAARRAAAMLERLDRHRRSIAQQAPLGAADLRMLWLFTDGQSRTLRQIADELSLEQSTVNRQVNNALKDDLLQRLEQRTGSAYLIEPTQRGKMLFESSVSATLSGYEAALRGLGDKQDTFLDLLDAFVTAHENIAIRSDTRQPGV